MKIYKALIKFEIVSECEEPAVGSPEGIVKYMAGAFDEDPTVEWFYVIILNRKNFPLGRVAVTKGTATASLVHCREVFKPVILAGGTGLVAVHNHPSGDPSPSSADISITRNLDKSGKLLGIPVLDHIIIGDAQSDPRGIGYYSFSDGGLI